MNNSNFAVINNSVNNIINGLMDGAQNGSKSKCFDTVLKESELLAATAQQLLVAEPGKQLHAFANALNGIAHIGLQCRNRKVFTRKRVYAAMADPCVLPIIAIVKLLSNSLL